MGKLVINVPSFEDKKEMFSYLRKNSDKIIAQKKAFPTTSDDLEFGYSIVNSTKSFIGTKSTAQETPVEGELPVEVIANLSGWCDTQLDVMIKDNWNKSINDLGASGQKLFYHLKDHGTNYQYTLDSVIGKDSVLFNKMIDLSIFNFKSDIKKAQALMMSSNVLKKYDEKAYNLYEDGQIKQHSIGLQYVKIYLCLNSDEPEDAQYKDNWDKYYPQVINKEKVDSTSYFWAVVESKIFEVSAVLFGSNELTPTTSVGKSNKEVKTNTEVEPALTTHEQPLRKSFDIKQILQNI